MKDNALDVYIGVMWFALAVVVVELVLIIFVELVDVLHR